MQHRARSLFFLFLCFGLLLSACGGSENQDPVVVFLGTPVLTESEACSTSGQEAALRSQYRGDVQQQQQGAPVYHLSFETAVVDYSYTGHATICYTNRSKKSIQDIVLRFYNRRTGGSLEISQLKVNGKDAKTRPGADLTYELVPLEKPLEPGQHTVLSMKYVGTYPEKTGHYPNDGYNFGVMGYLGSIFALSNFYPQVGVLEEQGWDQDPMSPEHADATYAETSFYTVNLVVPKAQKVLAVGTEINKKELNERQIGYQYVTGPVREFAAIMSNKFEIEQQEINGITYRSAYLPGDTHTEKLEAQRVLKAAAEAVDAFDTQIGPYPYKKMDLAPVNTEAAGIEKPTMLIFTAYRYTEPSEKEGPGDYERVVSHEIAHNWFYGLMGNDQIEHAWLDEGITTYVTALQSEMTAMKAGASHSALQEIRETREEELFMRLRRYYNSLGEDIIVDKHTNDLVAQVPITGNTSYLTNYATTYASYYKTAFMYKTYRDIYGDEAFWTFLKTFYKNQKYGIAKPDDALKALQAGAPGHDEEIKTFFNRWLREKHIVEDLSL